MTDIKDSDLPHEHVDVFDVVQVTHGTPLQSSVAADIVVVQPGGTSGIHRHNDAETVLYMLDGAGAIVVDGADVPVVAGDRVLVGKAVFHGVKTEDQALTFLSVQSPPILDQASGHMDLEPQQP